MLCNNESIDDTSADGAVAQISDAAVEAAADPAHRQCGRDHAGKSAN